MSKPDASSTVKKLLGEDEFDGPEQQRSLSPEEEALGQIDQAIAAGKPMTISIGPDSLARIRDFIEKPHYRSNAMAIRDLLVTATSP